VTYCRCDRDGVGPDWDITPHDGECRTCSRTVAPADVRRMHATANAALSDQNPLRPVDECLSCGQPFIRGRPEWAFCLACELEHGR
jgi:hypothetical protein